jgi:hypothetical protein
VLRLFSSVLILLVICVASVTASLLLGDSQPDDPAHNPLARIGFTRCGDDICVFGIRPGITRWDDARTLLDAAGIAYAESRFTPISTFNLEGLRGRLFIQSTDGTDRVGVITWQGNPERYRLEYGWLLLSFGKPCDHQDVQQASFKNLYTRLYNPYTGFRLHSPAWLMVLYGSGLPAAACDKLNP